MDQFQREFFLFGRHDVLSASSHTALRPAIYLPMSVVRMCGFTQCEKTVNDKRRTTNRPLLRQHLLKKLQRPRIIRLPQPEHRLLPHFRIAIRFRHLD